MQHGMDSRTLIFYNKAMANQVFISEENVIECRVIGNQTAESVQAMGKKIESLLAQRKVQHKPLLVLDDVTHMGSVPPAARNYVVSLAKTLPYDRLAMLGKGGLVRIGANLLIRASGRRNRLRYFSNRQEAIAWLLAEKR